MHDEPLNFEEHRRRRDENASSVRCGRCGKWILATATRCPECGIHFLGEAQFFAADPDKSGYEPSRLPWWVIVTAFLLFTTMVLGMLGLR